MGLGRVRLPGTLVALLMTIFRSLPGDVLIELLKSRVSVRPYVRTYFPVNKKFFSDLDLILSVGRRRPDMRTSVICDLDPIQGQR